MAHTLPSELLSSCTNGMLWCYWDWADTVTIGFFTVAALATFSLILYLATARFGSTRAFGFASFGGMMGAIWLATMQLLAWWVATVFIILGVIGLAIMALERGN